jgi:hypothetical protein
MWYVLGRGQVGKPEGKRELGRPRRVLEGNIKIYLKEIDWKIMEWIYLARDSNMWHELCSFHLVILGEESRVL